MEVPSRNLVICCDGTNNQFGPENTNVVRLIQALVRDPAKQRLYYDPGVGTLPEPGLLTSIGKTISKIWGLAFGSGILRNVEEAYSYLMEMWQPGDRVFLFGFSRGAYTVRVLAGLLHALGLLPRGNENLLPYVIRLYKASRSENATAYRKVCDDFRWTFARQPHQGDDQRHFKTHFVGLWDTVSSVGWVWNPQSFRFTTHNPSVEHVRHAIAIDERRCSFRQNLFQPLEAQDVIEAWFPGVHCDVGGGYPEQMKTVPATYSHMWKLSFQWMLDQAGKCGLCVDQNRLQKVLNKTPPTVQPWLDPQHESLTLGWWPVEFFPKLAWRPDLKRSVPRLGLGRHRYIQQGANIHSSALMRIRTSTYAPPNLSEAFLSKVRALNDVPEMLPYQ